MESSWHKKPRKCSDAKGRFPYADPRVPMILVGFGPVSVEGDGMNWSYAQGDKASLIAQAAADDTDALRVLAVWPGAHRTDVFVVDDLEEAAAAL